MEQTDEGVGAQESARRWRWRVVAPRDTRILFVIRPGANVSFLLLAFGYCGLGLQDQAHEFGLALRAGLVEHMREVCPCRRQRNAKPVCCRSQPIGFQYLTSEIGFRPSQAEVPAESFPTDDGNLVWIGDEQDRSRPDDIDPSESGTVRCHEHGQRRLVLAREAEAPAGAAELVSRFSAIGDRLA